MDVAAPVAPPSAPVAPAPAAPAESGLTPAQNPADKASAAPTDAKPAETGDRPEAQGKNRAERKISRLYREAAEAKAERDFYRRQFESTQKPAAPTEGAPTLAQFDYDPEKYADAKAEYAKTQALKERDVKQRTESVRQEHQRLTATWEERVERGSDKYDDFEERVGRVQPGTPFTDAIIECENAEDVAYYLGTNPTEAHRILQLSPRSQIREIGKLEAKLLATPPKPKTPSKAPAPVAPLAGTSPAVNDTPSVTDPDKVWFEKRLKQGRGR